MSCRAAPIVAIRGKKLFSQSKREKSVFSYDSVTLTSVDTLLSIMHTSIYICSVH